MYAQLVGTERVKVETDNLQIIAATFGIMTGGAGVTIDGGSIITTNDLPCEQISSQSVLDFAMSTTSTAIAFPVAFVPASTRGISKPDNTTIRITKKGTYTFIVQLATDKTSSVFFICKKDGVNMDGGMFLFFLSLLKIKTKEFLKQAI